MLRLFSMADELKLLNEVPVASPPTSVAFFGSKPMAVVGFRSGELMLSKVSQATKADFVLENLPQTKTLSNDAITAIAISGRLVATGDANGSVRFWQLREDQLDVLFTLHDLPFAVKKMRFNAEGTNLAILTDHSYDIKILKIDSIRRRLDDYSLNWRD